jgi:large subunit ribosomal protein L4
MATVDIVDAAGKKSGSRDLPAEIFEAPVNVPLMHQVVVAAMAGQRAGTHKTKTRGEVSGGGKKPWRQKGTGRARQGSIRSPQWAGGGVAHGPVPRDHSQRINKKMVKGALRSALADALASGKLAVIDGLTFEEPKTKQAVELLAALGFEGRVLLVLPRPTEDAAVEKSFRNLPMVRICYTQGLGTYDVLLADHVVFTTEALDALGGEAA